MIDEDYFVDVWHGDILVEADLSSQLEEQTYWLVLDENEKRKVNRLSRPELQRKYIKTRGVLRSILASYLNTKPKEIIIKTGDYGKPHLINEALNFNLSHTDNRLVVAVCNMDAIGVDIEQNKVRNGISGIVEKCFSDAEQLYWNALPEEKKIDMFYRFWVKKEAFVKAVGRGISLGLEQCVINPQNQTRFLSIPEGCGVASDWKIVDVMLKQNDVCSIVTKKTLFEYEQIEINHKTF